jgi:Cytochrome c7 and related cytochrome c
MKRFSQLFFALLPLLALLCVVPLALAEDGSGAVVHGLAPVPGNEPLPAIFMPPGSAPGDTGPSEVIFPNQNITIRFNHTKHLGKEIGAQCKTCHSAAFKSTSASDSLIPTGEVCDACHSTDHADLTKVKPGDEAMGQCAFCHLGYKAEDGNKVAPLQMPRANLVFNHNAHVSRNIACAQCHGAIDHVELATRDQLPRMNGCFRCHESADSASRGNAKSACETCHVGGGGNGTRIQTMFASGTLQPPRWLHNAEHTPDFILRHRMVAADDSRFCANCHKEDFCTDCHDGRVRPRSIHPNDYLNMHAIEARMDTQKCTSCHREQSFCINCHFRVGINDSPPVTKDSIRLHPAKAIWSDPPRKPGHHAFEAERNLNACISCHIESDCVACHGARGVGGTYNPHPAGFISGCRRQYGRNPRPCLVCHEPNDSVLNQCR